MEKICLPIVAARVGASHDRETAAERRHHVTGLCRVSAALDSYPSPGRPVVIPLADHVGYRLCHLRVFTGVLH